MRWTARRTLAALGVAAGLVGATAALARPEQDAGVPAAAGTAPRVLDAGEFTVRLRLGLGDAQSRPWNGRVKLDRGEVVGVEGGRFRKGDGVEGRDGWKAHSLPIRKAAAAAKKALAKKAAAAKGEVGGPGNSGPTVTPTVVLVRLKAPEDATLTVTTDQGEFAVPLRDLAGGQPKRALDGRAEAQRVPATVALAATELQEDFPSAVPDGDGGAWVAYVAHSTRGTEVSRAYAERPRSFAELAPTGGGDQVRLVHLERGRPGAPRDVTPPGLDVVRPAVAARRDGRLTVVWSENRDGNFDLYAAVVDPKADARPQAVRLTTDPGADADPALAAAPDGRVWVAWQAWRDGQARVLVAPVGDGPISDPVPAGGKAGNEWSPSVAVDARGNAWVAFDVYAESGYDVHVRKFGPDGRAAGEPVVVAGSPKYEAHASVAADPSGRVWVAYEERTANWGKDAENLVTGKGSTLYRSAAVRVRCLDGERLLDAPDPLEAVPNAEGLHAFNSFPRLACDPAGRVWLAYRHRQEAVWGQNSVMVVGGVWVEYATCLAGASWSAPQPLPSSDGLLDNRPALLAPADGPALAVYSSDGRLRREVEFTPELAANYYSHSGTPPGVVNNDLFAAALVPPAARTAAPALKLVTGKEPADAAVEAVHPDESADVARMRGYRVQSGGKTYRLLRGDFHRHTEVSQDGGSDGTLEDMWRYAIDAAGFDWMGNADHDNGGGKEYTWWLVQKTTDLYHSPKLTTMFTYERSVSYPHGHRNVMFSKRGVRTLPRLVADGQVVDADTPMLYDYLKEHGGITASHTSGTGMGTDWRDVNPLYEPMVEIFQGHRNSYEHLGAPRVARRPGEAIGGWRPLGMVWNALALQYRFGFQASSDHISTHISYAVAVAEQPTREGVLEAFRRRHCYGATDNIVLDVRTADGRHLMGDEFTARPGEPVGLSVVVHGTRPIAKVDVIKDFVYVYTTEPKAPRVEFTWTDNETRGPGLSWYYVRAIQDDGQIAWASPIWVSFPAGGGGR